MSSTATDRLTGITTSVAVKPPCRVATTAATTLAGLLTIDGVTLAAGDRVLVKDQASAIANGIYVAATGSWERALDFNGSLDAVGGTQLRVNGGSTNADTYWRVSGDGAVVIGTDEIEFGPDLLAASANISFLQAGTGAVPLSAQTKLRQIVNPADFGFATAGTGAANATTLTSAMAALTSGGIVNIGPGTFTLNKVDVPEGITLQGAGIGVTILTQGTLPDASYGMLYAESGSDTTYVENITIRDMTLQNTAGTFSEFTHLAAFAGAKNLRFERVKFKGFRGDGVCLHTRAVSDTTERHNIDVQVVDCEFDGVNKENRQGISITDCDGFKAVRCKFIDCGKSTMPGAIDFEPDQTYSVIRNVSVEACTFENVGGNLAAVAVYIPATSALPVGISIVGNYFKDLTNFAAIFIGVNRTLTAASADMAVNIDGNSGDGGNIPIDLRACKGPVVTGSNVFQNCTEPCHIGDTAATDKAWNVTWDARLLNCATALGADTAGIYVGNVDGLKLGGMIYKCGDDLSTSYPIRFTVAASNNVTIRDLRIVLNTNQVNAIEGTGHTFTPASNHFDYASCDLGGGVSEFPATGKGQLLTASATWDPSSLADGAGETSSAITVTGAAFGDTVQVAAPYDLQGITCNGYVSAADAVKIRLQNETGGTIDLASGSWRILVTKAIA